MKFFDRIRFEHVLFTLAAGMILLVAGAFWEQSAVQQTGLMLVIFGALVYLMIRKRHFQARQDNRDDA